MSDTSKSLRKAADEIENEGHLGWGNTCRWAADEFDALASRLAEADANAPWLTQAHMICTDHGIPQGNISDRLEMLVGYLAEAERDAERLNSGTIRFGNHVYCDVDLRACIDAAREGK